MIDILQMRQIDAEKYFANRDEIFEDTPQEYIKIVIMVVKKWNDRRVVKAILASEDALGNLATELMKADWRWDPEYINDNGETVSQYIFRRQCLVNAIKQLLRRQQKTPRQLSLCERHARTESSTKYEPSEFFIKVETSQELLEIMHDCLTELEFKCVQMRFYENKHFSDIGKEIERTPQGAHKIVERSIAKLRLHVKTGYN